MRNKAFTLIEVLVVMTIIGVLASVVLVSFSGQRERAKLTTAQQFDAQISHALGAYAVGIWRFEEGSGTTLYDASGFDNDGTLGDGTCVPGAGTCPDFVDSEVYSGTTALQFDGIDDYIEISDSSSLNITDAITIEAWVKFTSTGTYHPIYSKADINSPWQGVVFWITSGDQISMEVIQDFVSNQYRSRTGTTVFATGTWYHVAASWNSLDDIRLFVNGTEEIYSSSNGSISDWNYSHSGNPLIGNRATHFSHGAIDNVAIYDEALSVGQIQQNYAQGATAHNIVIK